MEELFAAHRRLGVAVNSTDDELKRAFRRLALQHHPDRAKVSSEACSRQFLEAQRAYEMICDYRKRRQLAREYAAKGPSPATAEMHQAAAASAAASRAPRVMSNMTAAMAAGAIVCAGVYMGTLKYRFAKKALERHLSGSYVVKAEEAQVSA
ncbi:hypothetical protein GUITHDRAFT_155011 [Guillardia theta CCMP2712]|uniref:J domain-containing protein n=2 Tax=Guillardia theta TaxID=55529 RepID=L1ILP1_GUITC|nr:hypothetical protein GUITHDRAFT_155011 [Guillardia theta CCMP2712]EKX37176.1 hypothetical protein GUITHDRAFT_155011 [Guillardia theta CCMP2712]|mmetsp:Transcript_9370/g.31337  ORF Transcript_9370/g.31337 Transcript_9370/m.31337 type:complete len:152 (+) Transcript_9370:576-1031(+)|eukprot:XP_005824156.1 hypothetical protein GUITHDRAFT_155011 [Guillardia theta CCMP2712]